jgi:hypothetical protein
MAGEVPQGDPGQGILAVEVVGVDPRAHPGGVRRIGVLALPRSPAADEAMQLQVRHQDHHQVSGDLVCLRG